MMVRPDSSAAASVQATNELDLVVKELPEEITEESLRTYFSRYGQLRHCEVIEGTYTHTHALLSFSRVDELDRALDTQPHVIDGSEVFLRYATNELDLVIRELPERITEESLRTYFSRYGQLRHCEKRKVGGYVFKVPEGAERIFRKNGTKNSIINEGFTFRNSNGRTGNEAYPWKWKCNDKDCKATLWVTEKWESDDVGQFRRGVVRSKTHGSGGRPHPKPELDSDKAGDVAEAEDDEPDVAANVPEAEDDEELAAELTALDLEEPAEDQPDADQPSTSRASAPPQQPTMRALSSDADIAAAIALAAAVLPDLPQHMRDPVIESATNPRSTNFAHGYFGDKGQLVGLIIGLKNHWTPLMKSLISPLSEERRLAGANSYRTAYIALLAVDPKHRKQGIGKALVNAFVADVQPAAANVQPAAAVLPVPPVRPAQQDNPPNIMYLHVRESNEAAMQFYASKALKFKRHPRVDVRYYGTEDAVIFVRRLESRSASESRAPKWPSGPPTKPSKPGPKSKLRDKSTGRANIQF
ncbi:RNA recognition motif domain-containing protein [Ditylenchus destructor]|nr:RNA recognition motif domain-containing protein [Ditylenchus destructor]